MNNTKIAIGCIVQWYEVEVYEEYLQSVIDAIEYGNNKENVIVDLCFYLSQNIEKIDETQIPLNKIHERFKATEQLLKDKKISHNVNYFDSSSTTPYTIADYRRDFNLFYSKIVDVLMWGESDSLIPQQSFLSIDYMHTNSIKNNIPKYLGFFSTCKMWDETWEVLEHPDFAIHPYVSGPDNADKWWSTWYTMDKKEMNKINNISDINIIKSNELKFNGCGLIISSEVIKSGVNIPPSIMMIHEDTAFMLMIQKILGEIPQYIVKNLLLVHNRKHPKKRLYVLDEDINENNPTEKRENNKLYKKIWTLDNNNCYRMFDPNYKSYSWEDVYNPNVNIKQN